MFPYYVLQLGGIVTPNDGKCHLDSKGYYTKSIDQVGKLTGLLRSKFLLLYIHWEDDARSNHIMTVFGVIVGSGSASQLERLTSGPLFLKYLNEVKQSLTW